MASEAFHEGERRVQERMGQTEQAERNGPMIGDRIPAGALPFLAQQSLLVLALLDEGAMWCLPLTGEAGWMSATREAVCLDLKRAIGPVDERILSAAERGQTAGGIVLDFHTRRRLRINGRLESGAEGTILLRVAEAYPNCPKYITQRTIAWSEEFSNPRVRAGRKLSGDQRAALRRADVMFLATQHPERGQDASHRGGNPGFLESPSENTLRFAEYAGNSMFNTLGNLEVDPRVGVLVPDFSNGCALAITGEATIDHEGAGATQWMNVTVQGWMEVGLPGREIARQLSPFNPQGVLS